MRPGLRTGTPVKVREGPFCGAVGCVVERPPHRLTLIRIKVLGREVCVRGRPAAHRRVELTELGRARRRRRVGVAAAAAAGA